MRPIQERLNLKLDEGMIRISAEEALSPLKKWKEEKRAVAIVGVLATVPSILLVRAGGVIETISPLAVTVPEMAWRVDIPLDSDAEYGYRDITEDGFESELRIVLPGLKLAFGLCTGTDAFSERWRDLWREMES